MAKAQNIIRKALLLGIGAASLTKETAESIAKKIKKDYNLNEAEGRKLAEDILETSRLHIKTISKEAQKYAGSLIREFEETSRPKKTRKRKR